MNKGKKLESYNVGKDYLTKGSSGFAMSSNAASKNIILLLLSKNVGNKILGKNLLLKKANSAKLSLMNLFNFKKNQVIKKSIKVLVTNGTLTPEDLIIFINSLSKGKIDYLSILYSVVNRHVSKSRFFYEDITKDIYDILSSMNRYSEIYNDLLEKKKLELCTDSLLPSNNDGITDIEESHIIRQIGRDVLSNRTDLNLDDISNKYGESSIDGMLYRIGKLFLEKTSIGLLKKELKSGSGDIILYSLFDQLEGSEHLIKKFIVNLTKKQFFIIINLLSVSLLSKFLDVLIKGGYFDKKSHNYISQSDLLDGIFISKKNSSLITSFTEKGILLEDCVSGGNKKNFLENISANISANKKEQSISNSSMKDNITKGKVSLDKAYEYCIRLSEGSSDQTSIADAIIKTHGFINKDNINSINVVKLLFLTSNPNDSMCILLGLMKPYQDNVELVLGWSVDKKDFELGELFNFRSSSKNAMNENYEKIQVYNTLLFHLISRKVVEPDNFSSLFIRDSN